MDAAGLLLMLGYRYRIFGQSRCRLALSIPVLQEVRICWTIATIVLASFACRLALWILLLVAQLQIRRFQSLLLSLTDDVMA